MKRDYQKEGTRRRVCEEFAGPGQRKQRGKEGETGCREIEKRNLRKKERERERKKERGLEKERKRVRERKKENLKKKERE